MSLGSFVGPAGPEGTEVAGFRISYETLLILAETSEGADSVADSTYYHSDDIRYHKPYRVFGRDVAAALSVRPVNADTYRAVRSL